MPSKYLWTLRWTNSRFSRKTITSIPRTATTTTTTLPPATPAIKRSNRGHSSKNSNNSCRSSNSNNNNNNSDESNNSDEGDSRKTTAAAATTTTTTTRTTTAASNSFNLLEFTGNRDGPPMEIEGRSLLLEQSNEEFPVATSAFARSVPNSGTTHAGVMSSRFAPWHPSATNASTIYKYSIYIYILYLSY